MSRQGLLTPYIPEPWRSKFFATRHVGERIYYDAPDYAHCYAMRADTFPPDGEIERWAGHPYIAQILIAAEPRPSWGDPRYDPIWAAATKHAIPVSCHLGRGDFDTLPIPPVGLPSYNHDFMVTYSLTAANQV